MAEASDFKFDRPTQLGVAKAHHKITLTDKNGRGRELWSSRKFGVPFNISATAEARVV